MAGEEGEASIDEGQFFHTPGEFVSLLNDGRAKLRRNQVAATFYAQAGKLRRLRQRQMELPETNEHPQPVDVLRRVVPVAVLGPLRHRRQATPLVEPDGVGCGSGLPGEVADLHGYHGRH